MDVKQNLSLYFYIQHIYLYTGSVWIVALPNQVPSWMTYAESDPDFRASFPPPFQAPHPDSKPSTSISAHCLPRISLFSPVAEDTDGRRLGFELGLELGFLEWFGLVVGLLQHEIVPYCILHRHSWLRFQGLKYPLDHCIDWMVPRAWLLLNIQLGLWTRTILAPVPVSQSTIPHGLDQTGGWATTHSPLYLQRDAYCVACGAYVQIHMHM